MTAPSPATGTAPSGGRLRASLWWIAIVVGLVVLALVAGAPGTPRRALDPGSTSANGTKALVLLLGESGAEVDVRDTSPDRSVEVAVLLSDSTSEAMTAELEAWVAGGGTLVVADPRSSFTPGAVGDTALYGMIDTALTRGTCDLRALEGVEQVRPSSGAFYDPPEGAPVCFAGQAGAFVVDVPTGDGHVVSVGSPSLFTNQRLGDDDNAALAVALMAPRSGTTVSVLYGMVPDGANRSSGLLGAVPTGVWLGLVQVAIAFLVYAWWRGRRLGRPVVEPQLVQIGGSELVDAVGNLLQQTHDPDRAARLLRADLRRRLAERLGLPPGTSPDVLAQVTAARAGVDQAQVARAVTDVPVRTEDELLDLARDIDRIRTEVLHGTVP